MFHEQNMGKGACIKTATPFISGEYVIIQDADLEYDPNDISKFLILAKIKNYKPWMRKGIS